MRWTLAALCIASSAQAQGERPDDTHDDARDTAARESVNPLPYVTLLKVLPMYTWSNDGTDYKAELELQGTLPYEGALIPGLVIDDVWSIARLQITAESLQNANGTTSGFENLNFVDVAAYVFGTLAIGAGVGTVFPMATSSELGPAKWQLGPAAAFNFTPTPLFSIAALAQALWSVAGSNQVADQSYVTLQPFVTLHPGHGMVIKSDAQMKFYWQGGSTSVPVNLGLGYAFSKHFVGTLKGALTVVGDDDGAVQGTLELVFLR